MRTAVIGAAGQLGRDLVPRLSGEVIPLGRDRADLTNHTLLAETLDELKPDAVVNCAAYNFVDKAESEPEAAFATNAWGVRALAKLCGERGITLMHFSTDYVFGLAADRATPWNVEDAPGPVSVYGQSKLAGEYAVRTHCPNHYVVRTCGLYGVWGSGGKGGNFVETMRRVAGQGKPLKVVADQRCTPSYTVDVAAAAAALLATARYGLYHATNAGETTWHDLAAAAFEIGGVAADLQPTTSAAYNLPAKRPPYSVLSGRSLADAGVPPLRPWREALEAYMAERRAKPSH